MDDATLMTPFETLELSDAVQSMRVRLVHESRNPFFCECARHDAPAASDGARPSSPQRCEHGDCLADIPARSTYARSMFLDSFGGDPVCLPCATSRWGVTADEALSRRREFQERMRRVAEAANVGWSDRSA